MARLSAPNTPELDDENAELTRLEHERKIVELQQLACTAIQVIPGVVLKNGIPTPIPHGLGRAPVWVRESCVRGGTTTGHVHELRDAGIPDRKLYVTLQADNFGGDVTVDVLVL